MGDAPGVARDSFATPKAYRDRGPLCFAIGSAFFAGTVQGGGGNAEQVGSALGGAGGFDDAGDGLGGDRFARGAMLLWRRSAIGNTGGGVGGEKAELLIFRGVHAGLP